MAVGPRVIDGEIRLVGLKVSVQVESHIGHSPVEKGNNVMSSSLLPSPRSRPLGSNVDIYLTGNQQQRMVVRSTSLRNEDKNSHEDKLIGVDDYTSSGRPMNYSISGEPSFLLARCVQHSRPSVR